MDSGEQTTGMRDEHFNLVSVLYHSLQGADHLEVYIFDAETSGDERLAAFFREAQAMHIQIADRAKGLLGIPEARSAGGVSPDAISGGMPPEEASPEDMAGGMSPGDMAGGMPPEPEDAPPDGGPRVG